LMPMLFYTPDQEQVQKQSRRNNQGRSGEALDPSLYQGVIDRFNAVRTASKNAYEWMTSEDVARELARIDLPLSTYTQWYWKIDLHNLLHFLTLRVDTHAQWEIQVFGQIMAGMLKRVAPLSYEAWIDYDVCGSKLSRMELDAIRSLVKTENGDVTGTAGRLDTAALGKFGLAAREISELLQKLEPKPVPDFELELSRAVPPEVFAERFAAAVPKVDAAPLE
jgi:thymidylate synthase (FAD)